MKFQQEFSKIRNRNCINKNFLDDIKMLHFNVIIMLKYNMKEKVLRLKVFLSEMQDLGYFSPFHNGTSVSFCRVPTAERNGNIPLENLHLGNFLPLFVRS